MTTKENPKSKSSDEVEFTHSSGDTTLIAFALEFCVKGSVSLDTEQRNRMIEMRNDLVKDLPDDVVNKHMDRANKKLAELRFVDDSSEGELAN